jgi:hypothetical protein
MRVNYKLFCVEVLAVLAAYLVASLPVTSAASVNIYFSGYSESTGYNPQAYVSKSLSVNPSTLKVTVNVTNSIQSAGIEEVYVYSCKGLSPTSCVSSVAPDTSAGAFGAVYDWSAVADRISGYPQNANFLIIAKISGTPSVWTGFWYRIERTSSSVFNHHENVIEQMQINAKDEIEDVGRIRNFIEDNLMIPANTGWVASVVFPIASSLYVLKATTSGIETPQFTGEEIAGQQITDLNTDYAFVLANVSGTIAIFNPVLLNKNPDYICGSNGCESSLGETGWNCCTDCGCGSGYYCDLSGTCKLSSQITLSLDGIPQTAVSNCYEPHTLNITVKVNNPPTGMAFSSARYKLGTYTSQSTTCIGGEGTGYRYSCPVVVPAIPNCEAGSFNVGPNQINMTISFSDRGTQTSKEIYTTFPNIVVGSYACGADGCEYSLGEDSGKCCYDCPCPSGYCDFIEGEVLNCSCKNDPSSLSAKSVNPTGFYTYHAGDSVSFFAQIADAPSTLHVTGQSCSFKCVRSDGEICSASCSVSCSPAASSDPSVYNSTCSMSLSVPAYDSLVGYSLNPTLNLSISYKNGSFGTVQKILSTPMVTINIGAHWCGDGMCNPDEDSSGCCYDCPCMEGQYCDTADTSSHTQGDQCMSDPVVQIESMSSGIFTDSYEDHVLNVTGHMSRPGGLEFMPECSLGNEEDSAPCDVACEETAGSIEKTYRFLCQVVIPAMDYRDSPFYDESTNTMVFTDNSLEIEIVYNNGSSRASELFSFDLPQIETFVIPDCGNGDCEDTAGENSQTCCIDCGCFSGSGSSGYFCYEGRQDNGECLSITTIDMIIEEIEPDPVECQIIEKGGVCSTVSSSSVFPKVMNPPSDLEIIEASFRIDDEENYTEIECYPFVDEEGMYDCAFLLEDIENPNPGTEEKTLHLKMSFAYSADDVLMTYEDEESMTFAVTRNYSTFLATCIEQEESVEKQIEKVESEKTLYTVLAVMFLATAVGLSIACYFGCGWCCKAEVIAWLIATCALAFFLIPKMSSLSSDLDSLKAEKSTLCGASDFGSLSSSVSAMGNIGYTIAQVATTTVCLLLGFKVIGAISKGTAISGGKGFIANIVDWIKGIFKGVEKVIPVETPEGGETAFA